MATTQSASNRAEPAALQSPQLLAPLSHPAELGRGDTALRTRSSPSFPSLPSLPLRGGATASPQRSPTRRGRSGAGAVPVPGTHLLVGVQEEAVPDAAQPLRGEHPPPLAARSLGAAQEQHHVLQEDHRVIERKEEAIGEKDRQDLKRDQQIHT